MDYNIGVVSFHVCWTCLDVDSQQEKNNCVRIYLCFKLIQPQGAWVCTKWFVSIRTWKMNATTMWSGNQVLLMDTWNMTGWGANLSRTINGFWKPWKPQCRLWPSPSSVGTITTTTLHNSQGQAQALTMQWLSWRNVKCNGFLRNNWFLAHWQSSLQPWIGVHLSIHPSAIRIWVDCKGNVKWPCWVPKKIEKSVSKLLL